MSFFANLIDKVGTALRLPELGISETLSGGQKTTNTGAKAPSAFLDPKNQQSYESAVGITPSQAPTNNAAGPTYNAGGVYASAPQAVGGSVGTGVGAGGSGAGVSLTPPNQNLPGTDISQLGLIEQQYQDYMNSLNGYEGNINNQFGQSTGLLGSQNAEALGQLNTQEANQVAGVRADAQSAGIQAANTQAQQESQLRQLLGDLQQRQNARSSIVGNSSVNDAQNEAYGKQAFQGISTIQQQRSQAEQQIAATTQKNLTGLQDFYNKSRMSLTQGYQTAIQQLTQQRDDKLAAIGEARNQAATTKAQNSFAAWQDYLSNKRQLDLQTFQAAQQLQAYTAQKQAALAQQYQTAKVTLNQTYDPLTGQTSTTRSVDQTIPADQVGTYLQGGQGGGEGSYQVGNDPNDPFGLNGL